MNTERIETVQVIARIALAGRDSRTRDLLTCLSEVSRRDLVVPAVSRGGCCIRPRRTQEDVRPRKNLNDLRTSTALDKASRGVRLHEEDANIEKTKQQGFEAVGAGVAEVPVPTLIAGSEEGGTRTTIMPVLSHFVSLLYCSMPSCLFSWVCTFPNTCTILLLSSACLLSSGICGARVRSSASPSARTS